MLELILSPLAAEAMDAANICLATLNLFSAVGLIVVNKVLLSMWPHTLLLSAVHSVFTLMSTRVLFYLKFYDAPILPAKVVAEVAFWGLLSITLMNLNLLFNPIGIYQASKLAILPVTALIEWFLLGKQFSRDTIVSIVFILVGIGLSLPDPVYVSLFSPSLKVSFNGCVYAILSTVVAATSVIKINSAQASNDTSSLGLLDSQQRYVLLFCFASAYIFEDNENSTLWSLNERKHIPLLFLSGLLAVLINTTGFLIIKRITPLSFQVLNHLKTLTTLTVGVFIFKESLSHRQIFGVLSAISGMVVYGHVRSRETAFCERFVKLFSSFRHFFLCLGLFTFAVHYYTTFPTNQLKFLRGFSYTVS